MKVVCGSIEEFVAELEVEASRNRVWQKAVRLRIERVPEQKEQVSFGVSFIGTVLVGGAHPEYLLEFMGVSGVDGRRPNDGTSTAEAWRAAVKVICDQYGLDLRRGKVEIS